MHGYRHFLADKWPDSELEIRVNALSTMVYLQFYLLMMMSMNADMYLAIRIPLRHRTHFTSSTTVTLILSFAILTTAYYALWLVLAPSHYFRYYPGAMLSSVALEQPSVYAICFPLEIPTWGAIAFSLAIGYRLRQLSSRPNLRVSFSPPATLQIAAEQDRKHGSTSQEQESLQVNDVIGIQISSKQQPILNSLENIDEPSCRSYSSPSDTLAGQPESIPPEKQSSTCTIPISNPNPPLLSHVDRGSQVHVAQRRHFKLTFLMLIRFALVYIVAEVVAWVVLMVAGFDEAITLCYSLYLNCVGDAFLYRFLNPRYGETRREIALAATQRLSQLKLCLNQRLMRALSLIIEFI